jgi:hypothetical protein
VNEYVPFVEKLTGPLGCTSPYASCTAKAAELGLMPDKLSDIVPDTVTVTIFPFGGQSALGLAEAVTTGGVLSMLIPLTVAVAELPATSVQVPLTDCPAPSAERTVGAGGLPSAKPERLSVHVKLTVTLVLFQPFAFGAGDRIPAMLGGVLSIWTVTALGGSTFPLLSVAKKEIVVTPSLLIVNDVEFPLTLVEETF